MSEHDWITKDGLHEAMSIVYSHLQGEWPEDEWFELLGMKLDLNLWTGAAHNTLNATLYPVKDGKTDTQTWVTVFHYGNWSKTHD